MKTLFLVYTTTQIRRGKLTDYYKIVAQSVYTEEYKERLLNRAIRNQLHSDYPDCWEVYASETNKLTTKNVKLY